MFGVYYSIGISRSTFVPIEILESILNLPPARLISVYALGSPIAEPEVGELPFP
ncbi:hypothetical protein D3C72_2123150 [compost metagenome]